MFLLIQPTHYAVSYAINPWMSPDRWAADAVALGQSANAASSALATALREAGAQTEIVDGIEGAPDLVFPANAAVVLDKRAVLARFLHPERQVEEPFNRALFERFRERGLLSEVIELPAGAIQEGAGDAIWDERRGLFWAGYGQRSNRLGAQALAAIFAHEFVPLELAMPRFYHLDTCFCPLPGGEVLHFPAAFTSQSLRAIRDRVSSSDLIVANQEEAGRFCVNAVAFGQTVVMARTTDRLRGILSERGYRVVEVDLSPFILSGGGAYCMTLRLNRTSALAAPMPALEAAQ